MINSPFANTIIVFERNFYMKSLFSKYVWLQLILSILLLFGGAVIIAFAINNNTGVLEYGLNIVVAVILFLFGLFAILTSFIFETKKYITVSLLYGSASIALGVFLCTRQFMILEYIIYLIAIFMIVLGSVQLLKAILLTVRKEKDKLALIIITCILAVLLITAGILAIIFQKDLKNVLNIVASIIAGVLLVVAGVYELILGIKALITNKKKASQVVEEKKEEPAPEVQPEEPKEEEIKELDYTSNQIERK